MNELSIAIKNVKEMININMFGIKNHDSFGLFDGYQRVYFQTNENIDDYLSLYDISQKENALCVAGSGDQAFSLITKGINNIQLFDINKLTEYIVIGLKKAIILKYNYDEYFEIIMKLTNPLNNSMIIYNIINSLIPYMEEKYQIFWLEIINYYKMLQIREKHNSINLINMLCLTNIEQLISNNSSYLNSEEDYNNLKNKLKNATISFKYANALTLKKDFKNNKFDLILLSNILDYFHMYWGNNWPIAYLNNYVDSLNSIMNNNGILYLHYAFNPHFWPNIFNGTNIKISNLSAIYEIKKINNLNNFGNSKQKDAIILKRMR